MTLKLDRWPWKTIGHLFYATSSFLHHFVTNGEFILALQSRNTQFGSKSMIFEPCDLAIWHMTVNKANLRDLIAATGLVILLKFHPIHRFLAPVTFKFDGWPRKSFRAHLLYYIKLCASFQIHRQIQTQVAVWKCPIRVKIGNFLSLVTRKFNGWPWYTIGHLFYTLSSFVHHFKTMDEFKLEFQSGNAQFVSKSAIFCPVWLWYLMDDLEKE